MRQASHARARAVTVPRSAAEPSFVDTVIELYLARGARAYTLDRVTHLDHALQAATLAAELNATDTLICAALLHDVGHLLEPSHEDLADLFVDRAHEDHGAAWLAGCLGPEVTEPVRLHVSAKRYLCAVEPSYFDVLSPAALRRLEQQGGPMNAADCERFERLEHAQTAIALRRIDDRARTPGMVVPDIEAFRGCIEASLPYYAR